MLFPPNEANADHAHANNSTRRKDVLLMGTKPFWNLLTSVKLRIGEHGTILETYQVQIKKLGERAAGDDEEDVRGAKKDLRRLSGYLTR